MKPSDTLLNSMCETELQKKLLEVINDKTLTDLEKIQTLVEYIKKDNHD